MKQCIHCGAELPDAAGFCPYCRRRQKQDPRAERRRPWGKLMAVGAVVALALVVWGVAVLIGHLRYTPVSVSSQGASVEYSDRSGSYVLNLRFTPTTPPAARTGIRNSCAAWRARRSRRCPETARRR